MYASWGFYQSVYRGGRIPQAEFDALARQAGWLLDRLTYGRIDRTWAARDCVRLACCAVCDVLHEDMRRGGPGVVREKLDAYEVMYAPEGPQASLVRRALDAARTHLWRTGLLSCAVGAARRGGLYA